MPMLPEDKIRKHLQDLATHIRVCKPCKCPMCLLAVQTMGISSSVLKWVLGEDVSDYEGLADELSKEAAAHHRAN